MKELVKFKGLYEESDQMITKEVDVYSLTGEQVFTATGGYEIIKRYFVRERDQKEFEARFREGREPENMMLLERVRKPTETKVEITATSVLVQNFGVGITYNVERVLQENGYKIVKDDTKQ